MISLNMISSLLLLSCLHPGLAASDLEDKMTDIMDRMTRMEEEMALKDARIGELERSQSELMSAVSRHEETPYSFTCGWREQWVLDNSNITYERLLYSASSDLNGGLDITSGVYTAWISGTWSITYSSTSVQYSGDIIQAFVYVNGEMLLESQYWASYFESSGRVSSLGSRTLHLHLNAGDTVTLGTGDQGHYGEFSGLWYVTFCVELKQTDMV